MIAVSFRHVREMLDPRPAEQDVFPRPAEPRAIGLARGRFAA
jgi:hypothetical protein